MKAIDLLADLVSCESLPRVLANIEDELLRIRNDAMKQASNAMKAGADNPRQLRNALGELKYCYGQANAAQEALDAMERAKGSRPLPAEPTATGY